MKKAILYARVSSKLQEKERTIESQVEELKKQISEAGDVLVKEYIDDGYSGALLNRPAMDALRGDLKTDLFEAVYFLNTDRIARDVAYQTIIIAEILRWKKQLIINGKDYVHNPENKFELTVLGAVSELERAKIIERSVRGKLHRLRQGFLLGNGYNVYGYTYVPRDGDKPAAYLVNDTQAKIIRIIFKWFVDEGASWSTIIRSLEKMGARTKTGQTTWNPLKIRSILQCHSYSGIKYFNKCFHKKTQISPLRMAKYGTKVYKDRSEWIGVKIPAIVSQKMFDAAQARIEANKIKYTNPREMQLLSNFVRCGLCGMKCSPYQRFVRKYREENGKSVRTERLFHKVAYRCVRRIQQRLHANDSDFLRCTSPEVSSKVLEPQVWSLIEKNMLDPIKIKKHLEHSKVRSKFDYEMMDQKLKDLAMKLKRLAEEKRDILNGYARGKVTRNEYSENSLRCDNEINGIKIERAELLKKIPLLHKRNIVDASISQFCDTTRARFQKCTDFENKRQFLLDYIESIIYRPNKITIVGSVPIQLVVYNDPDQPSEASKITFRIDGALIRPSCSLTYHLEPSQ